MPNAVKISRLAIAAAILPVLSVLITTIYGGCSCIPFPIIPEIFSLLMITAAALLALTAWSIIIKKKQRGRLLVMLSFLLCTLSLFYLLASMGPCPSCTLPPRCQATTGFDCSTMDFGQEYITIKLINREDAEIISPSVTEARDISNTHLPLDADECKIIDPFSGRAISEITAGQEFVIHCTVNSRYWKTDKRPTINIRAQYLALEETRTLEVIASDTIS
jgi:hypothetical protein